MGRAGLIRAVTHPTISTGEIDVSHERPRVAPRVLTAGSAAPVGREGRVIAAQIQETAGALLRVAATVSTVFCVEVSEDVRCGARRWWCRRRWWRLQVKLKDGFPCARAEQTSSIR